MDNEIRVGLEDVVQGFEALDDPRSDVNWHHPLPSVIVMAVMAVLAGAGGPTAIARRAALKEELLITLLPLPYGVPRKDVFRRVLSALKPEAFQRCFANWLESLREAAEEAGGVAQPVLSVDGKTLRRSHDRKRGLGPLHSVSVWASDSGLTLAQVATNEKANEITAIPALLKLADLSGAIITLDAMGTQTAIARQIVDGGGDYVLALKGNQGTLHQAVIDYVDEQWETDFADCVARRHVTEETGHGRQERRIAVQMPAPKTLPGFGRWKRLLTIGIVMLTCLRNGKQTYEARYYIASLPMGVKRFAHAVRSHWSIENTCPWSLDMTYREDESRIRAEHLRENFAWLNRLTLSLLKQHPSRDRLVMKRRCCGWNDDFLTEVLTGETI